MATLTTDAAGTTAINGGSVTTTGAQTYNDPVTLGAATTITGVANRFANTVNGAQALTVNDSGAMVFAAAVGGVTPLASLTTNAGGSTSVQSVTTTGSQTYNDALITSGTYTTTNSAFTAASTTQLAGATTVNTNGGNVNMSGAIDGAKALSINAGTGAVAFNSNIGGTTPLTSLSITSPSIFAHDVTTNGDQLYTGNVTFNSTETTNGGNFTVTGTTTAGSLGNNALLISTGAGNATLTGTVNGTTVGGQSLTINGTGVTTFGNSVGSTTPLSTFTTDAGGSSQFASSITVSGPAATSSTQLISINDTATATGNVTLNSTNGGAVTLNSFVTTPFTLSIGTNGSVIITGTSTLGSTANPVIFSQTPVNVQTINPIALTFSSPAQPSGLIFAPGSSVSAFLGGSGSAVTLAANASQLLANATVSSVQGTAAAAVAEASKVGFDTDSVAQQINYGFVGDVGVSPPMNHTIDETGVSVPEGFGEEEEEEDDSKKKK